MTTEEKINELAILIANLASCAIPTIGLDNYKYIANKVKRIIGENDD